MSKPIHIILEQLDQHIDLMSRINLEYELESEIPQGDNQQYLGTDNQGNSIFIPVQYFDDNGNEIVEPITYDNHHEAIW